MTSINDLNADFGLNGKLNFGLLAEGMPVANITTDLCTARIALQGAQVLEWTPAGQKPVIWLSPDSRFIPGKSIRGGTPICWPWFGAHESNPDFPAHGYARTVQWTMTDCKELKDGAIKLSFGLNPDPGIHHMWPHNSPLTLHVNLGHELELALISQNLESQPITITEAVHTYFAVSDVRQVRVSGLDKYDFLDKVDNFTRKSQQGDITFTGEVDRVYLDTEGECVINDSSWDRRIHINKSGSHSTVVWNPWTDKAIAMGDMGETGYLSMLCVESANAASNVVKIPAGGEHRLSVRYHVE